MSNKRFQKQAINSDADKRMEQGAKALKGGLGLAGALVLLCKNKDNLKTLGNSVAKCITNFIKKS